MSLEIAGLGVAYGEHVALESTSLALATGGLVALIGPNGAGKTTLLRAIGGLVPTTGSVSWHGRNLASFGGRARARTMAYLPQTPRAHWPMTVRELVTLGRLPHGASAGGTQADDDEAVRWAMRCTEVSALAERPIDTLSGGERARVLLARALAVRAPVLLVDEPVTSLDPYHQLEIMHVLGAYAADNRLVIAVLHDLTLAARYSTRVLMMDRARVVAAGKAEDVLVPAMLERHYRTSAFVAEHEGQPVIVPWRRLGR